MNYGQGIPRLVLVGMINGIGNCHVKNDEGNGICGCPSQIKFWYCGGLVRGRFIKITLKKLTYYLI